MTVELQTTGNVKVTAALKSWLDRNGYRPKSGGHQQYIFAAASAMAEGDLDGETYLSLVNPRTTKDTQTMTTKHITADELYGQKSSQRSYVRVKDAGERYCTTKSVGVHEKTGRPIVRDDGEPLTNPSQYELAKTGALMKKFAQRQGIDVELTEHDKDLLEECFADDWCGTVGGEYSTKIAGGRIKTLLDDAISGGLEAIPIFFDRNLVAFPLLHSEILPYIDLVDVPRGRRIEGASVGNPTVQWGQAEGTGFAEFNTAALVAALDSTVFPVVCGITVGRDALEDSPAALGAIVQTNIGQALMSDLDQRVMSGNGATQPEGITVAAGTTVVAKDGGVGAAWTVTDLENLMFSVGKQYRLGAFNPAFISNDTTYGRSRGIAVGVADQRRVFGMDHGSYKALEWPYRIEQNITNPTLIFGCLRKYRLFRRLGARFEWSKEGRTLMLSNETLLVMRARYAGRVVDANAFALCTTGQA